MSFLEPVKFEGDFRETRMGWGAVTCNYTSDYYQDL